MSTDPGTRIYSGALHTAYWFEHGDSTSPKKLFDSLDSAKKLNLFRAFRDYAESENINTDRGHEESWSDKSINGSLILFKYKCKDFTERFFAVVHDHPDGRRAVIVHGFKGHRSKRKEKDDPNYQQAKRTAEEKAKYYLTWAADCPGDPQ